MRFTGKIWFEGFDPCKRFDILQRWTVQLSSPIAKLMMSQLQKEGFHFKTDATNVVKGPHLWLILCTAEYLIWHRAPNQTQFQTD